MGKNKNQNRERGQASGAGSADHEQGKTGSVETQSEIMPSMSPNMSRKRGKKFGHN